MSDEEKQLAKTLVKLWSDFHSKRGTNTEVTLEEFILYLDIMSQDDDKGV